MPRCVKCNINAANLGFNLCQSCYNQKPKLSCTRCYSNVPTPGFNWCNDCYNAINYPMQGQPLCQECNRAAYFDPRTKTFAPGCKKEHTLTAQQKGLYTAR